MCVVRGRGYWDLGVKYALLYDYVVCNYMQKVNNMTNFYVLGGKDIYIWGLILERVEYF